MWELERTEKLGILWSFTWVDIKFSFSDDCIKLNCIFQPGFNDLHQLLYIAEGELLKHDFSWWVKVSAIGSVRWTHSAGLSNHHEDQGWEELVGAKWI